MLNFKGNIRSQVYSELLELMDGYIAWRDKRDSNESSQIKPSQNDIDFAVDFRNYIAYKMSTEN